MDNPLIRGLACAALNPDLRSILVFDGTIASLQSAADRLALMLEQVTGCNVVSARLGAIETEEDLWGSLALSGENADKSVEWRRGVLASGRDRELRLVVIPDLTRLSLAAARACVTLMGSDVAYLERHGHQDIWQPNLCWLAGCSRSDVGLVSPHLLDRFALRLGSQDIVATDRVAALQQWLEEPQESQKSKDKDLSVEWINALELAKSLQPEVTLAAQKRVFDYIVPGSGYSVRRELALMRLAQTNCQLDGIDLVTAQQVDLAARAIGLTRIESAFDPVALPEQPIEPFDTGEDSARHRDASETAAEIEERKPTLIEEPVYAPDTQETLPAHPIEMNRAIAAPYPEDTTPIQREASSLRLPLRRFKNAGAGRGAIVGVEPATVPQDLAIISTILTAAKYQPMRRSGLLQRQETISQREGFVNETGVEDRVNGERSLILLPSDLQRYRRAVVPEQMLALVLDRTCLKDCKWQESLSPYWQWAYEERASVCLIQVGAAKPRNELQAEKITADKILVPRIRLSLNVESGRATPLAHGLDLGLQTLRHALQHGRSAIQQVVLVVISDGRGNVPLAASRTGQMTLPVGRQGIEDALTVARQIAGLKEVKSVVLNPQPKHYRDLPVKLAQALGAKIAEIPPLNIWEVEE